MLKYDLIKKMIGLLALAFCIAHKTGEWRDQEVKAIQIKKHGRPQYNCFRYGLNWIKEKWYQSAEALNTLLSLIKRFFDEAQLAWEFILRDFCRVRR